LATNVRAQEVKRKLIFDNHCVQYSKQSERNNNRKKHEEIMGSDQKGGRKKPIWPKRRSIKRESRVKSSAPANINISIGNKGISRGDQSPLSKAPPLPLSPDPLFSKMACHLCSHISGLVGTALFPTRFLPSAILLQPIRICLDIMFLPKFNTGERPFHYSLRGYSC